MKSPSPPPLGESPAYLIAAAFSAWRSGDAELEKTARRRLRKQYGISLIFASPRIDEDTKTSEQSREGSSHA